MKRELKVLIMLETGLFRPLESHEKRVESALLATRSM